MKLNLEIDTNDRKSINDAVKILRTLVDETRQKQLMDEFAFKRIFNLDIKDLTPELISDFLDLAKERFKHKNTVKTLGESLILDSNPSSYYATCGGLKSILEELLKINYKQRSTAIDNGNYRSIGTISFAKEFQTIRLQVGRQSGHSNLAKEILAEDKNSLYISKSTPYHLDREFMNFNPDRYVNISSLKYRLGKQYSTIIIDDASTFTQEQLNEVYASYARSETQTFILLG